ncbi:MAG: hypothetical protein IPO08_23500 [Xanthomonadales bacterium]|nr:hypothetical protein [Xanthomonadales bacterium]
MDKKTILSQKLPSAAELMKDGARILNWNATPKEYDDVRRIVRRAVNLAVLHKVPLNGELLAQDLIAVHCNTCPLNFWHLLISSDDTFTHDVLGIGIHIDRTNAQLRDGWLPRTRKNLA